MTADIRSAEHPSIKRLREAQLHKNLSDERFVKWAQLKFSGTTWSRLHRGKYNGDTTAFCAECDAAVNQVEELIAAEAEAPAELFVPLKNQAIVLQGVKDCLRADERIVFFFAPPCCGKTTVANQLQKTHAENHVLVIGKPSWKGNYLAVLRDIALACGYTAEVRNMREGERIIIEQLTSRRVVLTIDEGQYLSLASIDIVKLIRNATNTRVVILALPELLDEMQTRAWKRIAPQIMGRTFVCVQISEDQPIKQADCEQFLRGHIPAMSAMPAEDVAAAVTRCREIANNLFAFRSLSSICRSVKRELGGDEPSLGMFIAAIANLPKFSPVAA